MGTDGDDLDRIIDGALAGYSVAEPLEGIERRVLNRVRTEGRRKRVYWGLALACAVASVVAFVVLRPLGVPVPPPSVAAIRPVQAGYEPAAGGEPAPHVKVRRARKLPRVRQFPLPAPLSGEERALLALVERHPAEAQQAFAELRKRGEEPLEIQPIQIVPLP